MRDPELEKELQDLKHQVQTLLSAAKTSPVQSTTSSITSHKSKPGVDLESKISRIESLVGSQMEVIANLQKTMEALNAKLEQDGSDTSFTTNTYQKRAKTGQRPRKTLARQDLSSNSESNHEMVKPPNPHIASTIPTDNNATDMDAGESELDGGIQDVDINESMLSGYHKDGTLSSESVSHEATQDDNDL